MFTLGFGWSLLTGILFVICFIFWMTQFFNMMSRNDKDFPGSYDKIIWAGLFIFANIFGAVVWFFYIPPSRKPGKEENTVVVSDASK